MAYSIIYSATAPLDPAPITLTKGGLPWVPLDTDTITLRYRKPDGTSYEVPLTIVDASKGKVQRSWDAGDIDQLGLYVGRVYVVRSGRVKMFPDSSSVLKWNVLAAR